MFDFTVIAISKGVFKIIIIILDARKFHPWKWHFMGLDLRVKS